MDYAFCTYFDRNYLFKGLALYRSLVEHCQAFRLWILCCDDETHDILETMRLPMVELIRLTDFEDEELRAVKGSRTPVEYLWTITPSLPLSLLIQHPALPHIAYLDADLFFFGSPRPIYEELGDSAVLIIGHRFPPARRDLERTSGIYNVGMLIFRNDADGRGVLRWWRERCLEECSYRDEGGTCGDQKYLDDWPTRFPRVCVLKHKGANLAPWNIEGFATTMDHGCLRVEGDPLIFYHFHQFRTLSPRKFDLGWYPLSQQEIRAIYHPYIVTMRGAMAAVRRLRPGFSGGLTPTGPLREVKRILLGQATFSPRCYYLPRRQAEG